jgi:ribosomal protein S18 acetylase RimI-like enzyme/effector-binding domain-containing protein
MADLVIRRAVGGDAGQLAAVHVDSWRAAYAGLVPEQVIAELSVAGREVAWRETIAAQGAMAWTLVAERAGTDHARTGGEARLLGFCSVLAPSRDPDDGGVAGEIAGLYVDPACWREGVGSALLTAGLAELEAAGFGEVTVWIMSGNTAAERFYAGFGFGRDGGEQVHERSGVTEVRLRRRAAGPRPGSGVRVIAVEGRPTVVVAETTTWAAFASVWPRLLDAVYAVVRGPDGPAGEPGEAGWRNVMLYVDDVPSVEVGVLGGAGFAGSGRVVGSALPAGEVAATVHRGSYGDLDVAHRRVLAWSRAVGRRLAGPRWEIYGHWREEPAELETEIYYLLE